jgi:hypothetical protein
MRVKAMKLIQVLLALGLILGCVPRVGKVAPVKSENTVFLTDNGMQLKVVVEKENVREKPNGKIIGVLTKGADIVVVKHAGNWVQFTNDRYKNAWIWAPSVGFDYINLYDPLTYYEPVNRTFYDIAYFQRLFSHKGKIRQYFETSYELFFDNLGLGSHETTVLDVVEATEQIVQQGVTFFVDRKSERITRVKVDYFKPVHGISEALKKSELLEKQPTEVNNGHVIWRESLIPGLIVDLERKEWNSDWFSSIWFILPKTK